MDTLIAKVRATEAGLFVVSAPAVGVLDSLPEPGRYLHPSEIVCHLEIMGRRVPVRLPRDVEGRVSEALVAGTWAAVDYGLPLFALGQAAPTVQERDKAGATKAASGESDLVPVRTPSQGVFYRRPSPDSPPYVEEGSTVTVGTVLGVVEVMKCFNQITYGGADVPARGSVVKILVADAAEVGFGQVIMQIKPV